MGYTHYYTQFSDFNDEEWTKIKSYAETMINNLPKTTSTAGGYYEDSPLELGDGLGQGAPVVDDTEIWLNGKGDLGHETFHLSKKRPPNPDYAKDRENYWDFTKTARKPYDLIVTAILLAANFVVPDKLQYDSDGNESDWEEGFKFFTETYNNVEFENDSQ